MDSFCFLTSRKEVLWKNKVIYSSQRWEERHHGDREVVGRVRDKYLMPRIRDFLVQLKKCKGEKMEWFDVEDLAVAALGYCDDDELDSATIEEKIDERFGVSMSQFQSIAEALMPLTIPGKSLVTDKLFHKSTIGTTC